ncbi:Histidine kinase [Dyadobacter koreensis]|uniref:Histidine kinase n=1 Tax=Dyadobacter koreensis TaxID=408657 RepID=A0A1H6QR63_9BACT|nr:histidine kinase [Dyadobacter koreensis]SEI46191.1 Histidine kinase [Dyadobacter koreensis]
MDRHAQHFPLRYMLQPQTLRQRMKYHALFWLLFMIFHLLYFAGSKEKIHFETSWVVSYGLYYLRFIPVYYLAAGAFSRLTEKYYGVSLMILTGILMVLLMHAANVAVFFTLDKGFGLSTLSKSFNDIGSLYLAPVSSNRLDDWWMLLIYDITETQLLFLPLGLKMTGYGARQQIEKRDLLAGKLKNDLAILRAQPAPHFILNTLNSVLAELLPVSEKAATYLVSLTEVLHFTLYETGNEMIALHREWAAIRHFLSLEARRFEDRLKVTVRENHPIPTDKLVPVLILFTLVENAFKHGVYPTFEDCWINISLIIWRDRLELSIRNSKPKIFHKPSSQNRIGIGLSNIKKRLQLSFLSTFELIATQTDDEFHVLLTLPFTQASENSQ